MNGVEISQEEREWIEKLTKAIVSLPGTPYCAACATEDWMAQLVLSDDGDLVCPRCGIGCGVIVKVNDKHRMLNEGVNNEWR